MSKYQDGKIYKITSKQTDKIYVGSTIQTLDERMKHHKTDMKRFYVSSAEILKYDDCIIELIEDCPCDSKKKLFEREQYYIDLYKDIIVNNRNTTQICNHNKKRWLCKECKGSQICEHNKVRYICKECKGNGICDHNKLRSNCNICNNVKMCIAISISRNKLPCKFRAKPDSDYCGRHTPK